MSARTGRCLCGAVTLSFETNESEQLDVCHCGMCRRWTGGPVMAVEAVGALSISGEEALGLYRASDWGERGFCVRCGSSLFWRTQDGSHVSVMAGCLDDPSGLTMGLEIFVDSQPDYYAFEGERRRMTGAEVEQLFASGASGSP